MMQEQYIRGLDETPKFDFYVYNKNKKWLLSKDEAKMSVLLHTITTEDQKCTSIEIDREDWVIDKVVEFLKYHNLIPMEKIEKPVKSQLIEDIVDYWDCKFIDLKNNELIELANTADYLHIDDLIALCLAKIACTIKLNKKFDIAPLNRLAGGARSTEGRGEASGITLPLI